MSFTDSSSRTGLHSQSFTASSRISRCGHLVYRQLTVDRQRTLTEDERWPEFLRSFRCKNLKYCKIFYWHISVFLFFSFLFPDLLQMRTLCSLILTSPHVSILARRPWDANLDLVTVRRGHGSEWSDNCGSYTGTLNDDMLLKYVKI